MKPMDTRRSITFWVCVSSAPSCMTTSMSFQYTEPAKCAAAPWCVKAAMPLGRARNSGCVAMLAALIPIAIVANSLRVACSGLSPAPTSGTPARVGHAHFYLVFGINRWHLPFTRASVGSVACVMTRMIIRQAGVNGLLALAAFAQSQVGTGQAGITVTLPRRAGAPVAGAPFSGELTVEDNSQQIYRALVFRNSEGKT